MDPEAKRARYRLLRGGGGIALAIFWIAYWWMKLEGERQFALSQPCQPHRGLFGWIADQTQGAASVCTNDINNTFSGGLFMALISAPLAFVVSHFLAKWLVAREEAVITKKRQQDDAMVHQAHQQTLERIGDEAAREASASKESNDRHELITRLGAVDDQLVVLEGEEDPARITRIKMTITQALRELDAKFTDEELRALMAAHRSVRARVDRTLGEMRRLGLEASRQFADLAEMFGLSEEEAPPTSDEELATPLAAAPLAEGA